MNILRKKTLFSLIFLPLISLISFFCQPKTQTNNEYVKTQLNSEIYLSSIEYRFEDYGSTNALFWSSNFKNTSLLDIKQMDFVIKLGSSSTNEWDSFNASYTLKLKAKKAENFTFSLYEIDKKYDKFAITQDALPVFVYNTFWETYSLYIWILVGIAGLIVLITLGFVAGAGADFVDAFEWIWEKWIWVLSVSVAILCLGIPIWIMTSNWLLTLAPVILMGVYIIASPIGALLGVILGPVFEWMGDFDISYLWDKEYRHTSKLIKKVDKGLRKRDLLEFKIEELREYIMITNSKVDPNLPFKELSAELIEEYDARIAGDYEEEPEEYDENYNDDDFEDDDFEDENEDGFDVQSVKVKSAAGNSQTLNRNAITLKDIAGLGAAKAAIEEKILLPLKHPEVYAKYNKKIGGGILLYGPPGTGKTMFAEAISNELNAAFYSIKSSDIKSKWIGDSESRIKKLFDSVRKDKVAVIFFDEFEAIGRKRSAEDSNSVDIVPEILAQIQGVGTSQHKNTLLIIAATNRPWDIDSALLRPGRFDEKIYIPLPDLPARKKMFELKLSTIPYDSSIDFEQLAKWTRGFNGSDIGEFCEKLKLILVKRNIETKREAVLNIEDVKAVGRNFRSSVVLADLEEFKKYNSQQ